MADFADYSLQDSRGDYAGANSLVGDARETGWNMLLRNALRTATAAAMSLALLASTGCFTNAMRNRVLMAEIPPDSEVPRELSKVSMPEYVIEPPDLLLIDAVKVIPKAPYHIEPLDFLQILVQGTLPDPLSQVAGTYQVDGSGNVVLGPTYGSVEVAGLTIPEAEAAIKQLMERTLKEVQVSVSLAQPAAKQLIAGEHLVGPDGTVNLGVYGTVRVTGLTEMQARRAIEEHLSQYLERPEISVSVFGLNSKFYYVVTLGGGATGDSIVRLPHTGNETVLDAIALIGGIQQQSNKRIWIARPSPDGSPCDQILPVDWEAIAQGGGTGTNYQLMPGDRIFIQPDPMIIFDSVVSRMLSPFDRVFGFGLLAAQTLQQINRFPYGQFPGINQGLNFF